MVYCSYLVPFFSNPFMSCSIIPNLFCIIIRAALNKKQQRAENSFLWFLMLRKLGFVESTLVCPNKETYLEVVFVCRRKVVNFCKICQYLRIHKFSSLPDTFSFQFNQKKQANLWLFFCHAYQNQINSAGLQSMRWCKREGIGQ